MHPDSDPLNHTRAMRWTSLSRTAHVLPFLRRSVVTAEAFQIRSTPPVHHDNADGFILVEASGPPLHSVPASSPRACRFRAYINPASEEPPNADFKLNRMAMERAGLDRQRVDLGGGDSAAQSLVAGVHPKRPGARSSLMFHIRPPSCPFRGLEPTGPLIGSGNQSVALDGGNGAE